MRVVEAGDTFLDEPIPDAMVGRPVDDRGFPIPWFVTNTDAEGKPDFVRVDPRRQDEAIATMTCWVSGQQIDRRMAFVIGPMCLVNRVAADPPVLPEIAEWSVKVCPFLSRPNRKRNPKPGPVTQAPGEMIMRNPGVSLIYSTPSAVWDGELLYLGPPESVTFWHQGRPATAAEVWHAFDSGLLLLKEMATREGPDALAELGRYVERAWQYLPPFPRDQPTGGGAVL